MKQHYLVPQQHKGLSKDLEYRVVAESDEDADDWFVDAKDRMLDVNGWPGYVADAGVSLLLTDSNGKPVKRHARAGDHIRVDTATGVQEWLLVESVEYDDYPDDNKETIAIRVHPVAAPVAGSVAVAHLPDEHDSATFVVERSGIQLKASYHGRAEDAANSNGAVWQGWSEGYWGALIKRFLQ